MLSIVLYMCETLSQWRKNMIEGNGVSILNYDGKVVRGWRRHSNEEFYASQNIIREWKSREYDGRDI